MGLFVWEMKAVGDGDSKGQLRQKRHMELSLLKHRACFIFVALKYLSGQIVPL